MNLEQQVVSLEYAKRLKELGVKQESLLFWWVDGINKPKVISDEQVCARYPCF